MNGWLFWGSIVYSLAAITYVWWDTYRAKKLLKRAEELLKRAEEHERNSRVILEHAYSLARKRNYP